MAIDATVSSVAGMSAEVARLYVPGESGGYRLDVAGGFQTAAEVAGLTSALEKERKRAADAEKALRAFDGLDASAAREALRRQAGGEGLDVLLASRLAPLEAERDTFRTLAEERGAALDAALLDVTLQSAKVFGEVADPIYRAHLMERVRTTLRVENGQVTGTGQNGLPLADSAGVPLTGEALLEAAVAAIPDVGRYFAGSAATGSGATPTTGHAATPPARFAACKTTAEKAAYLENENNLKRL